ncbi:MAG TPA: ATP-binding cassette domain-containing protein [Oleiagrimonas sp.]|nr:ATP-binding cassette domain-containing protein [Oleiagrimonas sp.]
MDNPTDSTNWLDAHAATVMRDGNRLLDAIDLRMARGEHTAILGANGSGKSTLVKLIERRLYPLARNPDGPERPHMRLFGRERWDISELRRLIGVVSADVQRDFADEATLSAYEAVVSGFFASRGLGLDQEVDADQKQQAMQALERMQAAHLAERVVGTLSTGEARRVLIARALVYRPRVLLLDEPCMGLDMASRRHFLADLGELARAGTTLVLVTHHVEEILPEIERVVMLRGGRILADGAKAELLGDARMSELFDMPIEVRRSGDWYSAQLC